MYCTHYIPSALICICTINKDYYKLQILITANIRYYTRKKIHMKKHYEIYIHTEKSK